MIQPFKSQANETELPPLAKNAPANSITIRAILMGLLLTLPNTYWIAVIEVRWYALDGTCLPLFITPIFFLFWLCLGNLFIRRVCPKAIQLCLTQAELLTIYIFLVIGTLLAGHDLTQNLFGSIAHADRYSTPENRWKDIFFALLPKYWLVRDPTAIKGLYQGNVSPYDPHYWMPFVGPLTWWTLFMGTLVGICLCMNILLRTHWSNNERLSFPIIQLPLAMTQFAENSAIKPSAGIFSSKAMWIGFALAASVTMLNGIHYLYPSVPQLEMVKQFPIGQYLTSRPWASINDLKTSLYPFMIGLAFFVPLDLSFSIWFFFMARCLFRVYGSAAGLDGAGSQGFPYFGEQASGAWIAWGLTIVWALRTQLKRVWNIAFRSQTSIDGDEIRMIGQYRFAFIGIALGIISLAWFSAKIGLTPWVAALFFGLYFLIALTITRARAELGTPHEIYFVNPRTILVTCFGTQAIGAQSLTALSVLYWFNRCYRCHPMPNQLEAMQLGEVARIRPNPLLWILILAFLWGTAAAYWANLHVSFTEGATSKAIGFKQWVGGESFNPLPAQLNPGQKVNAVQTLYMAAGFLIVLFLRGMRSSFLWWPFHPAGYALSVSFAMDYFWFCFFIAWLVKVLIVRYGGMRAYGRAIPFFEVRVKGITTPYKTAGFPIDG